MGIPKSTTDLTTITLKKYFSEKPKKNKQNRRAETEEKMKLAIVCVFAVILAINVAEGARWCLDGCGIMRKGPSDYKCRRVPCRPPYDSCVIRDSGFSIEADGCGPRMKPGCNYGPKGKGRVCFCPKTGCIYNHRRKDCKKFKKPIQRE